YVWPGDANADKIVNIQDVFSIGLAYNDTGPARDSISITWDRKCAFAWINFYASGANHAHGDCNGDGKINSDDIGAISANYGLTHTKNSSSVQYNVSTPDLYMTFSNDSLNPQDTFTATVHLGTDSAQSTSIYGIAFTLTYDDLLIESGSVIPGFSPSWIGNIADTSLISFSKIQTSNLVMVQVRTDRKNSIGFGEISQVSFEITANPGNSQALNFSFSDIHAIDSAGNPINITDTISNSVYISETTGILDYMSVSDVIKIFPNPTTGIVTVKSLSKRDEVFNISVFDILGNLILYVQHNPIQQDQSTIDLSNYRSGIYSIRIATSISAFSKKVVLTR
ncbi:MAG: T9SS type A sorting domain-containing protein, partial [Bacteroidia bacterium]|nr:T9SS type A sorting domain-containing protein [Bacteroidia bacterium]